MKSFDDLLSAAKVSDIMHKKDKDDNKIVWALAIIGAIAAVAGIGTASVQVFDSRLHGRL